MKSLAGCVALVTGGSRGIGPHIARALARQGAHVAVAARSVEALERVAASLVELGVRAVALETDVASVAERERLPERTMEALGPVDVLVNNAAIQSEGAFLLQDVGTVARTVAINLTAPIHLTGLVLPGMVERGRGHVVNIASLAGKKAVAYEAVYGGTKAGLIEWTSALRAELVGTGVSLSAVCPGYVTGEGMFARFGLAPPALIGSCTPEQVARAVVRSIQRDRAEVIVNSRPVRPLLALYALFPGLATRLLAAMGITDFQRRKVGG